jgi:hypothetical protein
MGIPNERLPEQIQTSGEPVLKDFLAYEYQTMGLYGL